MEEDGPAVAVFGRREVSDELLQQEAGDPVTSVRGSHSEAQDVASLCVLRVQGGTQDTTVLKKWKYSVISLFYTISSYLPSFTKCCSEGSSIHRPLWTRFGSFWGPRNC